MMNLSYTHTLNTAEYSSGEHRAGVCADTVDKVMLFVALVIIITALLSTSTLNKQLDAAKSGRVSHMYDASTEVDSCRKCGAPFQL